MNWVIVITLLDIVEIPEEVKKYFSYSLSLFVFFIWTNGFQRDTEIPYHVWTVA